MDELSPQSEARVTAPAPKVAGTDLAGTDLETIRKTVEDAAAVSGGLWITYLLALFYFAVAVSSVTHVDLFLENPVKAPFLDVALPLKAFFTLAPLMFLTIHAYTLVYFVMLSEKAKWYHAELRRQIPDDDDAGRQADDLRNRLRRRLPGNIFVQFLAGPEDVRESAFGFLLKAIAWSSLVIAPILVLLLMQVKFLPYHDQATTWLIRLVLLADLLLVWWLWHAILLGRGDDLKRRHWTRSAAPYLGAGLSVVAILFSWTIATFPGEWLDYALPQMRWVPGSEGQGPATKITLHDYIFHGPIDAASHTRGLLSDTLVVPSLDVAQKLKVDADPKATTQRFVFSAQGRDLQGAVFDLANLSNVDFRRANLSGASFVHAQLLGAWLPCANLDGASFRLAQVQGASFRAAWLARSDLADAQGAGAFFDGAWMQGADLTRATLPGASFNDAMLRDATLASATLDGAAFGTRFAPTSECQTPSVATADLEAANLANAYLRGATFKDANMSGARLEGAKLDATDLSSAQLSRVDLPGDATKAKMRAETASWQGRSNARDPDGPIAAAPEANAAYETALVSVFRGLTCPGNLNSLYVLRGLLANERFADVRAESATLIDPILDKKCLVSASLTDYDRANLFEARKRYAPEPPK